jgi:preprotein translocase subunit YajC
MPVSGFKPGDAVYTPSGTAATVVKVVKAAPEEVEVRYDVGPYANRVFRSSALRVKPL